MPTWNAPPFACSTTCSTGPAPESLRDADRDERRVAVARDGQRAARRCTCPGRLRAPRARRLANALELRRVDRVALRGDDDHVLFSLAHDSAGTPARSRPSAFVDSGLPIDVRRSSSARAARSPRARARPAPRRPRARASAADAPRTPARAARSIPCREFYSTVTVFARFRGWSTLRPRSRAMR